jgi:hypothetical protein
MGGRRVELQWRVVTGRGSDEVGVPVVARQRLGGVARFGSSHGGGQRGARWRQGLV